MNILKLLKKRKKPQTEPQKPSNRFEVTLSGSGGQGMITAGKILAEAATIYGDKKAVMTQSYGPEARGGASRSEVIISDQNIDYPKVMNVNVLLAMTQEAMDKYGKLLDPEGLLIVDDTFVKNIPDNFKNVFTAPLTSLAIKNLSAPIVANVMALAALVAITKIVSRESLTYAVAARVPKKALELNKRAVDVGFEVVENKK